MIRPLLLLLLFGTGFSTFAQDGARVLTLEDAVSLAQANNRSLKNAQLVASIDEDQIAEARTHRFPSISLYALGSELLTPVNFTFQQGVFGTFPGIGPVPPTNTKIHTPLRPAFYGLTQFSQPLSQQYKIGLNIKQAKLAKLVDEQKLRAQKQSVTSQVKQAYYAILRTQSSLERSTNLHTRRGSYRGRWQLSGTGGYTPGAVRFACHDGRARPVSCGKHVRLPRSPDWRAFQHQRATRDLGGGRPW